MRAGTVAWACLILTSAGAACAQQAASPDKLDDVLVTGTRVRTPLRESTDSVTEISRAQIEQMAPGGGADLFRQVPGLQIDQLGGPGGLSSVYIRGSDSNHVLVLIDGVRVNDSTNSRGGGFDMSSIDPANVERIEVLRGAASAVYGAEAMGGVINIITRDRGSSASVGLGGEGWRTLNGRYFDAVGALRYGLSASRLEDGSDERGGRIDLKQYAAMARWRPDTRGSFEFDARRVERQGSYFPDDSGGLLLAQIRTLEQKQGTETTFSGRGQWQASDGVDLHLSLSRYMHDEDIQSPGVAPGLRSDFGVPAAVSSTEQRRSNALASAQIRLGERGELAVGAEFQREEGGNHTVYDFFGQEIPVDFQLKRNTRSGFAELKWQAWQDLTLRLGERHDSVEGNGSRWSPSIGLNQQLPALQGSLRASYSTGFKPPSFFALGLPVALGGNPNLRPERSSGWYAGYDQRFWGDHGTAGIAVFKTRYTDLVTFDNETNQTVNANRVNIHGVELETALQLMQNLRLQAHFTRLLSRVVDSDEPLRQRPGRRGGIQLGWTPAPALDLGWRLEYAAQTFDSSIPTGNLFLPTLLRNDVTANWRVNGNLSLAAALDNAFNRQIENYVGAPAPGRRLRVTLNAAL